MLKRTPLVYMASQMALICEHCAADCTKNSPKILRPENSEKCELGCCSPVGSAQHRPRREPRPVRGRAPLALAHPTTRGFGVDVGTNHQERGRAGVARFPTQVQKRAVLVWCCGKNFGVKQAKTGRENRPRYPQNLREGKQRKRKIPSSSIEPLQRSLPISE